MRWSGTLKWWLEDVVGAVLRRCFVVVAIGSLVACGDSGGVTRPRVDQISSSEAPSPRPLIYTIEGTTVRSEPTFASEIIRQIPPGEALEYTAAVDGWYEIAAAPEQPVGWVHSDDVLTASVREDDARPRLQVADVSYAKLRSYAMVTGRVTNISDSPLEHVIARVDFFDQERRFVSTASGMIDNNPLPPGQTSPFSVMEADEKEIKSASVSFETLSGQSIASRYQR